MKVVSISPAVRVAATAGLLLWASSAAAEPDLRQGRAAGALTVYPDDGRHTLFYYPPGDLAVATRDGAPDIHLLHARYTGSVVTRDQGTSRLRSIFTVRVVLNGPTATQLTAARAALAKDTAGTVELRPLPIRRLETVIVYAPVAESAPPAAQPLPAGHFESADAAPPRQQGFWSERVYTLRLGPEDAQLLSAALEHGRVAFSIGYAFLAAGIGPDQPLDELSGSPMLVEQLSAAIAKPASGTTADTPDRVEPAPHVVRAGAVDVTADRSRWPQVVQRVDINESVPPGYAALDLYCFDFNQGGESRLYEKQVEIEAAGVGGAPVTLTTSFSRAQPDLYARSVRFAVAVRLDRPYRFRVTEIAGDGTSYTTPWREQGSWTELLDVTTQGERR
jgi:hypothetical protein